MVNYTMLHIHLLNSLYTGYIQEIDDSGYTHVDRPASSVRWEVMQKK